MKRYLIKEAFALQSAGGKLLLVGQYFATEDAAQQAELAKFAASGSCVENVSVQPKGAMKEPPKAPEEKKPDDDITVIPGVGKNVAEKLAAVGVTTVDELKAFAKKREDDLVEVVGERAAGKISAFFAQ